MPSQKGMEGVQQRRTESFEVIIFHRGEASLKAATWWDYLWSIHSLLESEGICR